MSSLSDFEIGKIAEIVAGRTGANLDARALRQVIDRVVDGLKAQQANPDVTGATCEVSSSKPTGAPGPPTSSRTDATASPTSEHIPASEKGTQRVLPPDEAMVTDKGGLYEQIEKSDHHRIIIAAFGKDRPGVGAALTGVLAEHNCSIEDISQTLMQEYFSMIMIVNIEGSSVDFATLRDKIAATEAQLGMKVYVMHEDIFRYMHRI